MEKEEEEEEEEEEIFNILSQTCHLREIVQVMLGYHCPLYFLLNVFEMRTIWGNLHRYLHTGIG